MPLPLPRPWLPLAAAALAGLALSAAEPFYIGEWKIDSAQVAPWADKNQKPGAAEKSLLGKLVKITPTGIAGPGLLNCRNPKYRVKDYPPGMLFQGAFEEMQSKDKSADPAKLAANLGFQGKTSKALETGCSNELDFHFPNPTTAEFGLNNYVYILKKQP